MDKIVKVQVGDLDKFQEVLSGDPDSKLDRVGVSCSIDGDAIAAIGTNNHNAGRNSFAVGENNMVYSDWSFAAGSDNYAGLRCWYYSAIDFEGNKIYLTGA